MDYLSTLIAVRLRIDDVQHMTSNATHVSHSASPSRQTEPLICTNTSTLICVCVIFLHRRQGAAKSNPCEKLNSHKRHDLNYVYRLMPMDIITIYCHIMNISFTLYV